MTVNQYTVQTEDGVKIAVCHHKAGHKHLIVIAHGFYNSKDALLLKDLADVLSKDYDVLALDFRGHGKSEGLYHWSSKEHLDLLAVLESVRGQYQKIGVIGFSLGGAITLITAGKTDLIDSIVAVSAPSSFNKVDYRIWRLNLFIDIKYTLFGKGRIGKGVRPGPFWLTKEKAADTVGNIKQPVLYIHGTKDWVVKPWHSKFLFEKTASPKQIEIIEQGPHAEYLLLTHQDRFISALKAWFSRTLVV